MLHIHIYICNHNLPTNINILLLQKQFISPTILNADDTETAHLSLQFRVFLRNATTKKYTQEKRVISYWFKLAFSPIQQAGAAQDFFKQLVSPVDFPRGKNLLVLHIYISNSHCTNKMYYLFA